MTIKGEVKFSVSPDEVLSLGQQVRLELNRALSLIKYHLMEAELDCDVKLGETDDVYTLSLDRVNSVDALARYVDHHPDLSSLHDSKIRELVGDVMPIKEGVDRLPVKELDALSSLKVVSLTVSLDENPNTLALLSGNKEFVCDIFEDIEEQIEKALESDIRMINENKNYYSLDASALDAALETDSRKVEM